MEFGPEIKVDGVRPDWLKSGQQHVMIYNGWWHHSDGREDPDHFGWCFSNGKPNITAIRLPANHPHYNLTTHTYTVRPEDEAALLASDPLLRSTPDEQAVAPELVARLVELARSVATSSACTILQTVEAQKILAALEPVDPMLLEARQVVAGLYEGQGVAHLREQALSGEGDEWFHTKVARAAIARGRQLEKEVK